jgi:hypothetical protein
VGGGLRSRVGESRSKSNGGGFIELTSEGTKPTSRYPKEMATTTAKVTTTSRHGAIWRRYY